MRKAVSYYRVSTGGQNKSGLGLEAQHKAVNDYARNAGLNVVQEYTETKSGKKNKRPVIKQALLVCKKLKAILLISNLDRLSRSVSFISALMESKVKFTVVDNPNAGSFMLHILAAVAEKEAIDISNRTKAALQAAKRRGVILGKFGRDVLSKLNFQAAMIFAKKMQPVIEKINAVGCKTVRCITNELNKQAVPTFTGNKANWHIRSVFSLLKRIKELNKNN